MKNISFDNPYMLLIAIPLFALVTVPFFITRNKDNRSIGWTVSLVIHFLISVLVALAAAGMTSTSVLTKTTVYVLADVSHSSERNLDEIDGYIAKIKESLPEKSKLGIVCFAKNSVVLTPAGRAVKSVSLAEVDDSATDIASALSYTETLFDGESLKRIILITDGNDTANNSVASLASTVSRLTDGGVKIDAIYLDNSLKDGDYEVQLEDVDVSEKTYTGHENEAKILIQSSGNVDVMLELFRKNASDTDGMYEKITQTVVAAESGYTTVRLALPSDEEGTFEYMVQLVGDKDISEHNNTYAFLQTIVGKTKILLITGNSADEELLRAAYTDNAEIDAYVVRSPGSRVPITLEEIIKYDQIAVANLDIRLIRNVNAFIDSVDMAVSQYGKSLIALGDLGLQNNSDDTVLKKFAELLPVEYGKTDVDGRLYTIVLDVSHSMFMASKFTIAKNAAIKLLSILNDDDYVCLVTFSGAIRVHQPKKVREYKSELIGYIDSLTTEHGTDMALGLEEALRTVKDLNLAENQVMIISDGFSFDSERSAYEVALDLYGEGATVSAINTYIPSDGEAGRTTLSRVVSAGKGGKYYSISSPERVEDVVFGDMADTIANVIVERDSLVNIVNSKDGIVSGFDTLPKVSGYILSVLKYDAAAPLTVTYLKPNGYQETVPLYAYRSHGNGKTVSFTGSLSDAWSKLWSSDVKSAFVTNMLVSTTPKTRLDCPFTLNVEVGDYETYIELVPGILDPSAAAQLTVTLPNGRAVKRTLAFDSTKYFYTLNTDNTGTYHISVSYSYGDNTYTAEHSFSIAYLPEYNVFASFDKYNLYQFIRDNGSTLVGEIPSLEYDENEIATYKESFVIPLLFAASALFIADIAVRKVKLSKKRRGRVGTGGVK